MQPRKLLSNLMNKLISYRIFILLKCKLVFQLSFVGFKQTATSSAPVTEARQFLIYMRRYFVASINILDGFFVTIVKLRGIYLIHMVIRTKAVRHGLEEPGRVLGGGFAEPLAGLPAILTLSEIKTPTRQHPLEKWQY